MGFSFAECPKHRVVVERELLGRIGTEVLGCNAQGIDVVYERVEQPIGNGIVGFALFDDSPVFTRKVQWRDAWQRILGSREIKCDPMPVGAVVFLEIAGFVIFVECPQDDIVGHIMRL